MPRRDPINRDFAMLALHGLARRLYYAALAYSGDSAAWDYLPGGLC